MLDMVEGSRDTSMSVTLLFFSSHSYQKLSSCLHAAWREGTIIYNDPSPDVATHAIPKVLQQSTAVNSRLIILYTQERLDATSSLPVGSDVASFSAFPSACQSNTNMLTPRYNIGLLNTAVLSCKTHRRKHTKYTAFAV